MNVLLLALRIREVTSESFSHRSQNASWISEHPHFSAEERFIVVCVDVNWPTVLSSVSSGVTTIIKSLHNWIFSTDWSVVSRRKTLAVTTQIK